jgi:hypothetical protein
MGLVVRGSMKKAMDNIWNGKISVRIAFLNISFVRKGNKCKLLPEFGCFQATFAAHLEHASYSI